MSKKKNINKRKEKSYYKVGDVTICVDDLIKAVNECDKKYGIRLKQPDIWREPEVYREIIESKAEMCIGALICVINGIDISDYFETDESENNYGTIFKPIGIEHAEFTELSKIDWYDLKSTYNTDSLLFRCRFLTLVLFRFFGRFDRVTYYALKSRKKLFNHSEDEQRIVLTKEVLNNIIKFTLLMLQADNSYKNIILRMQEYMNYTKRKVNHYTLKNLVNGHIIQLRNGMKNNLLMDRFYTDDMAIYSVLKIAYMITTNKTNLKTLPNFKYIENATVHHNLIKLIDELGAQIFRNTKSNRYPPMFQSFIDSRPKVWTQFYKESENSVNIRMGILALEYTKFMINDKALNYFIDEMKRGGK